MNYKLKLRERTRHKIRRNGKDNRIKFGSRFSAEWQELDVNVYAKKVKEDGWKASKEFTIGFGEKWYHGRLGQDRHSKKEGEAPNNEEYLIKDEVENDGWGGITIYRNLQWIADEIPNCVPTLDGPASW